MLSRSMELQASDWDAINNRFPNLEADVTEIAKKVWKNLQESGIFEQARKNSRHAHLIDPERYVGVKFWGEPVGHNFETRILIIDEAETGALIVPKLARFTDGPEEQQKTADRMWQGISREERLKVSLLKFKTYFDQTTHNWARMEHAQVIKKLFPRIRVDSVNVSINKWGEVVLSE